MIITEKTLMKDVAKVVAVANCSTVNLLDECRKHEYPKILNGVQILPFEDIPIISMFALWDATTPDEIMELVIEFLFFDNQTKYKTLDDFKKRWLPKVPLIYFYSFFASIIDQIIESKKNFSEIKIDLTEEEKAAGYGSPDKNGNISMLFAYANRLGKDVREAEKTPWTIIYTYFKLETDDANRQRKLNKIIIEKSKKK